MNRFPAHDPVSRRLIQVSLILLATLVLIQAIATWPPVRTQLDVRAGRFVPISASSAQSVRLRLYVAPRLQKPGVEVVCDGHHVRWLTTSVSMVVSGKRNIFLMLPQSSLAGQAFVAVDSTFSDDSLSGDTAIVRIQRGQRVQLSTAESSCR